MNKIQVVKQQVTIAFGLATLFGLGWGFGLAASGTTVHGLTLAFQIIFSILVGSQGVLFFLLYGIKKQEARNQWKLWFTKITSGPIHLYSVTKAASTVTDSKVTHSTYDMSTLTKGGTLPCKNEKVPEFIFKLENKTLSLVPMNEQLSSVPEKDKMDGEIVSVEIVVQPVWSDDLVITNSNTVDDN